jgi:cAMP phosphodiesterase
MELEILGAHNCESKDAKLTSLLVDGSVAIDVGSLTSSLSLDAQKMVRAILLTHRHYDHIRDLATFGMNIYSSGPVNIYALDSVLDIISTHLLNDIVYPDFQKKPKPEKPALEFCSLEPNKEINIEGYKVLPVPVNHIRFCLFL